MNMHEIDEYAWIRQESMNMHEFDGNNEYAWNRQE